MATLDLLELPYGREAVARTIRLYETGKATSQGVGTVSNYANVQYRGDYCHLDTRRDAVPDVGEAAIADLTELLEPEDQFRTTAAFLLRPRKEWPGEREHKAIPVHLGVKPGHYPLLLEKMEKGGMIEYRPEGEDVIQNSIFGIWKTVGVSQRVIWGGQRANIFFRGEASGKISFSEGRPAKWTFPHQISLRRSNFRLARRCI